MMVMGFSMPAQTGPIPGTQNLYDRGGGLIYDSDLNITWLQDANYANGRMWWDSAIFWASSLVYQGYSDWRLPTALNVDGSGPYSGYDVTGSEMGHLYYTELGNPAYGPLTNTGPFTNLQSVTYWSGTECPPFPNPFWTKAWYFYFGSGLQDFGEKYTLLYAWAVRPGDSAPIPEPATLLLLGSGLIGVLGLRKKFKK